LIRLARRHVSLFPIPPSAQSTGQEEFEREVAARFGLIPNFFRSAPDAPFVVRELWKFAKSAYLDTAMPTLFKERLFVYLSRFCEVRYCITRHCGFLLGLGRAAGDANASAMTIDQVIRLLQRPVPSENISQRRSPGWKRSPNRSIGPRPKPRMMMTY
jgi:hypothetical protein